MKKCTETHGITKVLKPISFIHLKRKLQIKDKTNTVNKKQGGDINT